MRLAAAHREYRSWPLTADDKPRRAPDGYIHLCAKCGDPWPCDVRLVLDALGVERQPERPPRSFR